MPSSLEDRVKRLEMQHYEAIGRIDACQKLIIYALVDIAMRQDEPTKAAEEMRETWQRGARNALKSSPDSDIDGSNVLMQEYEWAIDHLSRELVHAVLYAQENN